MYGTVRVVHGTEQKDHMVKHSSKGLFLYVHKAHSVAQLKTIISVHTCDSLPYRAEGSLLNPSNDPLEMGLTMILLLCTAMSR